MNINNFKGKSVKELELLYIQEELVYSDYLNLINCISDDTTGQSISWLIKRFINDNKKEAISDRNISNKLIEMIIKFNDFNILLNLLQILQVLIINNSYKDKLYFKLKELINKDNKFIRAWSYNGLYVLSLQYDEYKDDVFELLDFALINECASVNARIRKIIKEYEKK